MAAGTAAVTSESVTFHAPSSSSVAPSVGGFSKFMVAPSPSLCLTPASSKKYLSSEEEEGRCTQQQTKGTKGTKEDEEEEGDEGGGEYGFGAS